MIKYEPKNLKLVVINVRFPQSKSELELYVTASILTEAVI